MSFWYSVSLSNQTDIKYDYKRVVSESKRLFGKDSILFVPGDFATDEVYDTDCEGYVFVNTNLSPLSFTPKIKKSTIFYADEQQVPTQIPSSDIEFMKETFEKNHRNKFDKGDIVKIRFGHFSNLQAIVSKELDGHRYEVCIHLFSRNFIYVANSQNLEFLRSISIKPIRTPLRRIPVTDKRNVC